MAQPHGAVAWRLDARRPRRSACAVVRVPSSFASGRCDGVGQGRFVVTLNRTRNRRESAGIARDLKARFGRLVGIRRAPMQAPSDAAIRSSIPARGASAAPSEFASSTLGRSRFTWMARAKCVVCGIAEVLWCSSRAQTRTCVAAAYGLSDHETACSGPERGSMSRLTPSSRNFGALHARLAPFAVRLPPDDALVSMESNICSVCSILHLAHATLSNSQVQSTSVRATVYTTD